MTAPDLYRAAAVELATHAPPRALALWLQILQTADPKSARVTIHSRGTTPEDRAALHYLTAHGYVLRSPGRPSRGAVTVQVHGARVTLNHYHQANA